MSAQQSQPFQAVVFDLDGTLADSYEAITASVNHVRAAHGLPPLLEDEVRKHVGRGPTYLLEHTVPGADLETDLARYRAHHPSVLRSGTRLLPGVRETLERLHAAGLRLGVCSNKPRAFTVELLDYFGLAATFEAVIGPEDAPHLKPAPDMLVAALARLGLSAAKVLYVGDMTVDVATARAADVTVWAIPTGSDTRAALEAAAPDRILGAFGDLARLLLRR